ncbi:6-phosphogluconate dehydrogenase C-terminal domain-like protein [Daedaleopsis nitida]|nr:6-phosphogluconate dehydrogenase C-terminal domain-like protein [Daedaleopsis nitida]
MSQLKDVLLIGYGAVGAIYSLIMKRSGRARVTVIARGNYEVTKAHGMTFRSGKYGNIDGWQPDRLFHKLENALDRPYSYVVLTSKAIPELQRTPSLLAPMLSPPYSDAHSQPTYVLMQNGLNVEVDLYDALKKLRPNEEPRIISTAVWIGTGLVEKNVVEHNDFDRVQMGIYRPSPAPVQNTPSESALLDDFSSLLAVGGSETSVVHEIQRVKFAKNMWNGVLGASAALSRFSLREFFRPPHLEPVREGTLPGPDPEPVEERGPVCATASERATAEIPHASAAIGQYTVPFLYDTLNEVHTLGAALFPPSPDVDSSSERGGPGGTAKVAGLDPDVAYKTIANTARLHARPDSTHLPSMLVDIEAGRPMEIEHVVGEVVRMGRRAGVSLPRMETLYALLLVVQNQFLRRAREREGSVSSRM